MQDIHTEIANKFRNLTVDIEFRDEKSPVLYIYKSRNSKKGPDTLEEGYEYLMSPFHIVVSAVVSDNEELYLSFELCSYHGKVLISDIKPKDKYDNFQPILDLSESSYQVCSGQPVSKIHDLTFEQLKNDVLIERLDQNVVLRSRDCSYKLSKQEGITS